MNRKVSISEMSDVIMNELWEYADLATDDVKEAIKDAADTVKKNIQSSAPKHTGDYAKS